MSEAVNRRLAEALWKIYQRPDPAEPWTHGSDLIWSDPTFSERILRQHLDESHGAASRPASERLAQIDWFWSKLKLAPGHHLFDVTCGPGLYAVEFARRGCQVSGIDFSPASIAYARELALTENVSTHCDFVKQDIRHMDYSGANFEAAILLYGQLAVFPPDQARQILRRIFEALQPGGYLAIEILDQRQVDKENSRWWFTDDSGLWGDRPFLQLGERFWHVDKAASVERYHIVDLESGQLTEFYLTDQSYAVEEMVDTLEAAGFAGVTTYPAWDDLPLPDAEEWMIYLARRD